MRDLTVVFDLDGTLVDTAPDLVHATNHALGALGIAPIAEELLRPWISFGAQRMIVEGLGVAGREASADVVAPALDRFLDYYGANIARDSQPFPGCLAALDRLAGRGARLAVCTNKREGLSRQLLDELGLSSRFVALAGRDTFPVCKPDPQHLTGTLALAGGRAERAIMVGDSGVDIATAKAAGVPVVAVTFGYTDVPVAQLQPDVVIDHYDELERAVDMLSAR